MPITHDIPVSSLTNIINVAAAAGVTPEELCLDAGLDLSTLKDSENRIPFTQLLRFFEHAAGLTRDAAFGLHVGEQGNPKLFGILGYVAINSQTFGEALNRLIRFQQIRTKAYKFSVEITGSNVHLAYIYQTPRISPEECRHDAEETLCSVMKFGRMMTGVEWIAREVHFEHARPENISEHERIFRAPVRFGKLVTQLIFDSAFLTTPLVEADLTLGSLLERQAEELLAKSPDDDERAFVNQVQRLMRENLGSGEMRIETICQKLNIGSRTLQRKLREENTSFQKLLEETQSELSKFYLRQPEIAICEISYLLGFSQSSAFHRAFRRWTGLTPKAFRSEHKHQRHLFSDKK
jgi:AraC-like DNA-binding protein